MAQKVDIIIDQGADFSFPVQLIYANSDPIDLTGYSGAGQIRKQYSSTNATASFTVTIANSTGTVTIEANSSVTAGIVAGRYVYDVELTSNNIVSRIVEGQALVTPEVTRS